MMSTIARTLSHGPSRPASAGKDLARVTQSALIEKVSCSSRNDFEPVAEPQIQLHDRPEPALKKKRTVAEGEVPRSTPAGGSWS